MQGAGAAACETLNETPATLAVAVRVVCAVFAATVYVTVPGPVRPVPFWNVKKLLPLVALHAQPVCVVTVMVPVVPPYGALLLVGLIEYVQGAGVTGIVYCRGVEYSLVCTPS